MTPAWTVIGTICRSMNAPVFSSIKGTLGAAVRARSWWLEFREMLLKATVYNL